MGSFSKIKRNKGRIAAIIAVIAALGALAMGVGTTGAYFSDSHDGSVKGTIGTIKINPTSGTTFTYDNLLPGEPQTATLTYENTGRSPQDVWLTFPNATALSALNDLGTYGELHVVSNGTEIFGSANLNDHTDTCPTGCTPLPAKLKLASNVAPGGTGVATITFNYASKMKTQPADGTVAEFNVYPVASQFTVNAADGSGTGLPLRLVATQRNQTP
jgi:hypothetical protein